MLDNAQSTNPFLLNDIFPRLSANPLGQHIPKMIEKVLGLSYLANGYSQLDKANGGKPEVFVEQVFNHLNIRCEIAAGDTENIPQSGAAIVVANHPYGGVDGLAMIKLLKSRRDDIKIMANGFLKRVPEISDVILAVNPYGTRQAKQENFRAMREAMRWLNQGGLIFIFPAGDVSSIQFKELSVKDKAWDNTVVRLARQSKASIIPLHIDGRNSVGFYLGSVVHPRVKTLLLPREIIKKRGQCINLSLGKAISYKKLSSLKHEKARADLLKARTYALAKKVAQARTVEDSAFKPIIPAVNTNYLHNEIDSLDGSQHLVDGGDFQVYYARGKQIPLLMREIGRLREINFREVGEGTGEAIDIDRYDKDYIQLFIWHPQKQEIVGGYRLALTDEIVNQAGIEGLYSHSLFKFGKAFLNKMPPAIELGRSFVRKEYQRTFTPLMLLWKGIARFVYAHPHYTVLFGPVSISNDYSAQSRQLLIDYLKRNHYGHKLARHVKARQPYKSRIMQKARITDINLHSLDGLSAAISSFEDDSKGVPVLLRQYLKLGGQLLGFNLDKQFADCLDGFICVDLLKTQPKTLGKYMGQEESAEFLAFHQQQKLKAG